MIVTKNFSNNKISEIIYFQSYKIFCRFFAIEFISYLSTFKVKFIYKVEFF